MNDLISKKELLTNLIHCKGLGRGSFQALIDFLEDYPIEVDLDSIKEQIIIMDELSLKSKRNVIDILNKGGI